MPLDGGSIVREPYWQPNVAAGEVVIGAPGVEHRDEGTWFFSDRQHRGVDVKACAAVSGFFREPWIHGGDDNSERSQNIRNDSMVILPKYVIY